MKTHIISTLLFLSITACGPSESEIAAQEKAKADSIALTAQKEMLVKQAEAERQKAIADSIAAAIQEQLLLQQEEIRNKELLRTRLIELKSQFEVENMKLNDIKQFRLFRTRSEKERQFAEQVKLVEALRSQIHETEKQIDN